MDALAASFEHARDRVLREPVDFEIRMELAELVGDRHVALRVAQTDRGGDVERTLAPRLATYPRLRARGRRDEVAQQVVDLDGVAHMRAMPRTFEHHELCARRLGQPHAAVVTRDLVTRALDDQHRALDP